MSVDDRSQRVWPEMTRPIHKLIYLDLNHWISLAQAATGHRSGRQFVPLLGSCIAAKVGGHAIFPLSSTHFMEMSRIKDPGQRLDLVRVMEQLSDFRTLASRWAISRLEVDASVVYWLPGRRHVTLSLPLVGKGVGFAFGIRGGLRVGTRSGEDITTQVRSPGSEFDSALALAELQIERSCLAGPTDEQVPVLRRKYGWNPEASWELAEKRAEQEREQGERLNSEGGRWRRGRLRDVIVVRELIFELWNPLQDILRAHSLTDADVINDDIGPQAFLGTMPSAVAAVELKTAAHRNPEKSWEPNDIHDIDALAVAIPYCDVVVTEKHAHHVATVRGLDSRFGTTILRRATDLVPILESSHI